MEITMNVSGMSCEHCVKTVTSVLLEIEGVSNVSVSLEKNTVSASYVGEGTLELMKTAIEDAGYDL